MMKLVAMLTCLALGQTNPLAELPVLPKVTAHWPIPDARLDLADPVTVDFVRITQAVSVHGATVTQAQLRAALGIADAVHGEHHMAITLTVLLRPYHETPSPAQELAWLVAKLSWLDHTIKAALPTSDPAVLFILDSEILEASPETFTLYESYADILRVFFADARHEWYGRGIQRNSEAETGWSWMPHHGEGSYAVGYSCRLYAVPNWHQMEVTFRKTAELGVGPVVPWVALGAGYKSKENGLARQWVSPWDYHRTDSWQAGWQINNRWFGDRPEKFAPWNRADIVVLYPNPLKNDVQTAHFVDYVKGATH